MPRIRSIHPGWFTDENWVSVSPHARLLGIGIWTECDDQGAFDWKPVTLKMRIFPVDNVDIVALLEELAAADLVRRYVVGGRPYGAVRNFGKFQRPKKPKAVHPMPPEFRTYAASEVASSELDEDEEPPVPKRREKSSQMEDGGGIGEEEDREESQPSPVAPDVPARKPLLDDRSLEAALREAAGLENDPSPNLHIVGPIHALIGEGYDLEKHILPVLRSLNKQGKRWSSWQYVVNPIRERNAASPPKPGQEPPPPEKSLDAATKRRAQLSRAMAHLRDGRWSANAGPRRGEPGCRIPEDVWREAESIINAEKAVLKEALSAKPNGAAAHH